MWFDDVAGKSWTNLWSDQIVCGNCSGIRRLQGECPACGARLPDSTGVPVFIDGRETIVSHTYMGAEGRYEDWIYLQMLEREWKRPLTEADRPAAGDSRQRLSAKSAIVVLFWSYFETKIERLLRVSMREVPPRIVDDLLQRYSAVGARLDRLYRVLFETSYWADLTTLGYERVKDHLLKVQEHRNAFAHGDPNAIDDVLVQAVVENLKDEHDAWVAVFNKRAARP